MCANPSADAVKNPHFPASLIDSPVISDAAYGSLESPIKFSLVRCMQIAPQVLINPFDAQARWSLGSRNLPGYLPGYLSGSSSGTAPPSQSDRLTPKTRIDSSRPVRPNGITMALVRLSGGASTFSLVIAPLLKCRGDERIDTLALCRRHRVVLRSGEKERPSRLTETAVVRDVGRCFVRLLCRVFRQHWSFAFLQPRRLNLKRFGCLHQARALQFFRCAVTPQRD